MKYLILVLLCISGAKAFSQTTVDCKVSSTYELLASFDSSKNVLTYTSNVNGVSSVSAGVSFDQINKTEINKSQEILDLAKAANIAVENANSANVFVLSATVEVVDFINVNGESIGIGSIISGQNQACL